MYEWTLVLFNCFKIFVTFQKRLGPAVWVVSGSHLGSLRFEVKVLEVRWGRGTRKSHTARLPQTHLFV